MLSSESRSSESRADRDVMIDILSQLAGRDRDALLRFYVDAHQGHQIEHDLDLTTADLQALRRRVRVAFSDQKAARLRKR